MSEELLARLSSRSMPLSLKPLEESSLRLLSCFCSRTRFRSTCGIDLDLATRLGDNMSLDITR